MTFLYEEIPGGVRVIRVYGDEDRVCIPDQIDQKPVKELGAYAFSAHMDQEDLKSALKKGRIWSETGEGIKEISGENLREISLPSSLVRVGRYAFYNCQRLHRVSFFGALSDIGAGAFTGCHRILELLVEVQPEGDSCLGELLTELPETIRVELMQNGERGVFWFPEFFEEGVENTPARILENHIHGSGLRYRNCFQQRVLNKKEYDETFPYAKAWEDTDVVIHMALGRVLFPMEVGEKAREQYEAYLQENLREAAGILVKEKAYKALGELLRRLKPPRTMTLELLSDVQKDQDTQAASILMDYLYSHTKVKRQVFEL